MDWRGSRQKLQSTILDQAIRDREAGAHVGMSRWDLEEYAEREAERVVIKAKNIHEVDEIERKIRLGQAL